MPRHTVALRTDKSGVHIFIGWMSLKLRCIFLFDRVIILMLRNLKRCWCPQWSRGAKPTRFRIPWMEQSMAWPRPSYFSRYKLVPKGEIVKEKWQIGYNLIDSRGEEWRCLNNGFILARGVSRPSGRDVISHYLTNYIFLSIHARLWGPPWLWYKLNLLNLRVNPSHNLCL